MRLSFIGRFGMLIGLGLLAAGMLMFPAYHYQWSIPCFFKSYFNVHCAFCGGFRSLSYLVHGELAQAWHYNALITLLTPFALVFIVQYGIQFWHNKQKTFNVSMLQVYFFLALVVGFTFLRNASFYPYAF